VYVVEQPETFYAHTNNRHIWATISDVLIYIERTKPFNIINFNIKSESLLSTAYLSNNRSDYGDLKAEFDVDGTEFTLPLKIHYLAV
jgi:hypothetical protein